ncbi:hypothetical protein Y1Q_0004443 [Alligator mississippiensis]|uniref:Uncharacterized protein n=1 Tax=Alligator mississippiensis TaxID=8496 RepID=A0A151NU22_ALLMI|nr:hypothetical protein Y1Q_0004443 [Alligator mississippiensis]
MSSVQTPQGFTFKMPLLKKQENGEQVLVKNESYLQTLKNKDQRKRLVHEICTFLDSSQSVQEIDALRTENRKLKNANSRLRYKTKDWALKKEEYENEIERLSGEISNYLNVTNFWRKEQQRKKPNMLAFRQRACLDKRKGLLQLRLMKIAQG